MYINAFGEIENDKPVMVEKSIIVRTHLFPGGELVSLIVNKGEHDFQMELLPSGLWELTLKHSDFGDTRFSSPYVFGEPLEVIGLVSELNGLYDYIAEYLEQEKDCVLLLKRRK